jgi:asparagine synthase (glutamine-hydrolysing)
MTALAGLWNFDGKPDADASCRRMLASLQIYGPHDERRWSDGAVAMGRRLFRLLPEDRFDRQPLKSGDGNLILVADVRLDNREDLHAALDLSHADAAQCCDASILLKSFERWGEDALDRFVGDFALALWKPQERKLLLARDFLGQRPLHYHRGTNFFAFASMPKGLHALPDVPYAADEQAMAEFLTLMPEGDGRSFFKHICAVESGHAVTVTREGLTARRYWTPDRRELARPAGEDFIEGLRHHLDQATRARLRGANGPVASQLSAGFDSSSVTATAARLLAPEGGKLVAFTSVPRDGYTEPEIRNRIADEGPLAAATAALYPNVEHVLIRAGDVSPLEGIDRNFYLFDRPMLNLCNWTWMSAINQAAKDRGLTIMLNGQMGNMTISYNGLELLPELLGAGRLARLGRAGVQLVAKGNMPWLRVIANSFGAYTPAWVWSCFTRLLDRDLDILEYTAIRPSRIEAMDLASLARERGLDFSYRPRRNGFESRLWVLRRISLGNYNKGLLAGWGVDQRDPTADRRLVEYCLGVPMEAFLSEGEPRALGRRAMADRLPKAVLSERRKGYQAADWHEGLTAARGAIEAEVDRLGACGPAAQLLNVERLRAMAENWPASGWERGDTSNAYRLALLRGLSAGHFLRRASGANQ